MEKHYSKYQYVLFGDFSSILPRSNIALNWFKNILSNRNELRLGLYLSRHSSMILPWPSTCPLFQCDSAWHSSLYSNVLLMTLFSLDFLILSVTKLSHWAATWLVLFNPSLIFFRKLNKHPPPTDDHRFLFTCADPESFARGGPTLTTLFLVDDGRENSNTILMVILTYFWKGKQTKNY